MIRSCCMQIFAANRTSLQASMTALILTGQVLLLAVALPLTRAFPRQLLLPFGKENGDTALLSNLSQPILELPGLFTLYAHSNGAITDRPTPDEPQPFPLNYTVIAPLWTDYSSTGDIFYREITERNIASLGLVSHLLQATGAVLKSPTMAFVATWDGMTCLNNGTERVFTYQCVIARNDRAIAALFLLTASMTDDTPDNATAEGCFNPVVGYNFPLPPISMYDTAVNVSGGSDQALDDVTDSSNVNISGVWIFAFGPLPTTPPTRTPPTPRNINIPEWALSLWNVGQTIVSFLAGTGIGVLGVCCCNKCKQRRKDRKRHKGPKHDLESGLGSEVTVPSKCNSPAPSSHLVDKENDNDVQGSGSCTSLTVNPLASADHKGSQDGEDMTTEINLGQSPEIHKSNSETTLTMSQEILEEEKEEVEEEKEEVDGKESQSMEDEEDVRNKDEHVEDEDETKTEDYEEGKDMDSNGSDEEIEKEEVEEVKEEVDGKELQSVEDGEDVQNKDDHVEDKDETKTEDYEEGKDMDFNGSDEEITIGADDRKKIEYLAALTPHESDASKSYSLPATSAKMVQSASISLQTPNESNKRSLSLMQHSMSVVHSPHPSPAHSATHTNHSSTLSVGTRQSVEDGEDVRNKDEHVEDEYETKTEDYNEGEDMDFNGSDEEITIGADDRKKIEYLAALTPHKSSMSYSLPATPARMVQSASISLETPNESNKRSLSLMQSPKRHSMSVVHSPHPSPAHSATHMSHSSTLSVGTRERRLSWMALNADSDSNDEEKETDQSESPVVTSRATSVSSSPSRTHNLSVSSYNSPVHSYRKGSIPMSPSRLAETKINDRRPSVTIEDTDSVSEPEKEIPSVSNLLSVTDGTDIGIIDEEDEVFSDSSEEHITLGKDERERIKYLAALTPQKSAAGGKSYSLPGTPARMVFHDITPISSRGSLTISQSPKRHRMQIVHSPCGSPSRSSSLTVNPTMGERRLSWMAINANSDSDGENTEEKDIEQRSSMVTSRSASATSSPSRTRNMGVNSPYASPAHSYHHRGSLPFSPSRIAGAIATKLSGKSTPFTAENTTNVSNQEPENQASQMSPATLSGSRSEATSREQTAGETSVLPQKI